MRIHARTSALPHRVSLDSTSSAALNTLFCVLHQAGRNAAEVTSDADATTLDRRHVEAEVAKEIEVEEIGGKRPTVAWHMCVQRPTTLTQVFARSLYLIWCCFRPGAANGRQ